MCKLFASIATNGGTQVTVVCDARVKNSSSIPTVKPLIHCINISCWSDMFWKNANIILLRSHTQQNVEMCCQKCNIQLYEIARRMQFKASFLLEFSIFSIQVRNIIDIL